MEFFEKGGIVVYALAPEAPRSIHKGSKGATVNQLPCATCKKPVARSDHRLLTLEKVRSAVHTGCQIQCVRCRKTVARPLFSEIILLLGKEENVVWVPRHEVCPIFIARHAESLTHEAEAIHVGDYRLLDD